MPDHDPTLPPVPSSRAVPKSRTRLSLVWIVPIAAMAVGAWVAVARYMSQGPEITIVFKSAEGLEAGKTKIHYNGVDIGTLTSIRLSDDHGVVITTAQMAPKTESFLVDDTQFWVVRPRVSGANISGLGTLISGAYVGSEIGRSKKRRSEFVALPRPAGGHLRHPREVLPDEDARSRIARHRHAALLPAAERRQGHVVRARSGREGHDRQGLRRRAL